MHSSIPCPLQSVLAAPPLQIAWWEEPALGQSGCETRFHPELCCAVLKDKKTYSITTVFFLVEWPNSRLYFHSTDSHMNRCINWVNFFIYTTFLIPISYYPLQQRFFTACENKTAVELSLNLSYQTIQLELWGWTKVKGIHPHSKINTVYM